MNLVTRIAPTPSGYLHTGNIFSFLLTRAIAEKFHGKVWLRIDDLDADRSKPAYLNDIIETLHFLDIRYDQGPLNTEDFYRNFSQKLRADQYDSFLHHPAIQDLLYACTCSRKDLMKLAEAGSKRCNCRNKNLPLNTPGAAWRIYVPDDTVVRVPDILNGIAGIKLFEDMGDFVVRRRDGMASYQVSSLVDDLNFGINYIVRGNDLVVSSAAQLYLANLTGSHVFMSSSFLHHPLLTDINGVKLSKSAGSNSIKNRIAAGCSREEILFPLSKSVDQLLENREETLFGAI